ncbi:unnamed protein product, partial [Rotaria sp. Silwood1]
MSSASSSCFIKIIVLFHKGV